jgi:hypothetical protein
MLTCDGFAHQMCPGCIKETLTAAL